MKYSILQTKDQQELISFLKKELKPTRAQVNLLT